MGCDVNEHPDNVDGEQLPTSEELISAAPTADEADSTDSNSTDRTAPPATTAATSSPATAARYPVPVGPDCAARWSWWPRPATIGLLAVGGGTAASLAKSVTITVDGEQRQVTTLAGSVEGALSSAGLQAGDHDVLAPAADTADRRRLTDRPGARAPAQPDHQRPASATSGPPPTPSTRPCCSSARTPSALELSADRSREIPLDGLAVTANALRTVSLSVAGAAADPGADRCPHRRRRAGRPEHHPGRRPTRSTPALTTAVTDGLQITVTAGRGHHRHRDRRRARRPTSRSTIPTLDKGTTVVAVAGTARQAGGRHPGDHHQRRRDRPPGGLPDDGDRTHPEPGARRFQVHPGCAGQPGVLPRHRVRRQLGRPGLLRVHQQPERGEQPLRLPVDLRAVPVRPADLGIGRRQRQPGRRHRPRSSWCAPSCCTSPAASSRGCAATQQAARRPADPSPDPMPD